LKDCGLGFKAGIRSGTGVVRGGSDGLVALTGVGGFDATGGLGGTGLLSSLGTISALDNLGGIGLLAALGTSGVAFCPGEILRVRIFANFSASSLFTPSRLSFRLTLTGNEGALSSNSLGRTDALSDSIDDTTLDVERRGKGGITGAENDPSRDGNGGGGGRFVFASAYAFGIGVFGGGGISCWESLRGGGR